MLGLKFLFGRSRFLWDFGEKEIVKEYYFTAHYYDYKSINYKRDFLVFAKW